MIGANFHVRRGNIKNKFNIKCLTCKDEYCTKSFLNKISCTLFKTKKIAKSVIVATWLLVLAVVIPIIINIAYLIGSETQNTVFEGYHLLAYVGTVIFGLAVYSQTRKIHKKNQELQKRSADLEDYNLQYNTFAYLNILRVETSVDNYPLKTHALLKPVPWPLDVRATRYGYPNGEHDEMPRRYKKRLRKLIDEDKKLYPNGLNSTDDEEDVIKDKVMFSYTEIFSNGTTSTSFPPIDPYIGVYYAGTNSELVLWQRDFPIPRLYRYYTPITLNFFARSSRENFFVEMIETAKFEFTIRTPNRNFYRFSDKLDYIREPLMLKPTVLAENSFYSTKYKCNHVFSFTLHLCHSYSDLLDISAYEDMDMKFDAVYINTFGVRTKRRHGFKIGASIAKNKESSLVGFDGKPLKYRAYEKENLQHYTASDFSLEIERPDYSE